MLYTGLVSITFRKLKVEEIIELVKKANLDGIEWGGDIHVPHGDLKQAKKVAQMTKDAGLKVAAYGSYYRVGADNKGISFQQVLDTAINLDTPVIRVWAGNKGSNEADETCWSKVKEESRKIASQAQKEGIEIAYEYHGGTLTDTRETTLRLLKEVAHPNIYSYWQPAVNQNIEERLSGIKEIESFLSNVHAFQWDVHNRLPLEDGVKDWLKYLNLISKATEDIYVMLEFVKDDSPQQFLADAKVLKEMVKQVNEN